jgi:cytochrome c553
MQMTSALAGIAMSLLLTSSLALAQGTAPPPETKQAAPEAADGRSLFRTKTCIACHGRDGARAIQVFPEIAGQDKTYLYAQMKDIASGTRVSGKDERGYPRTQGMKDVMHLVSDEDMQKIAAFLATAPAAKPRKPTDPIEPAVLNKGKDAYLKGGCTTCHGVSGLKPLASYPIIGGMKKEYLALQMQEIRAGTRASGKIKLMMPFAKKLTDDQIELIATFLSQVERPAP